MCIFDVFFWAFDLSQSANALYEGTHHALVKHLPYMVSVAHSSVDYVLIKRVSENPVGAVVEPLGVSLLLVYSSRSE